MTSNLDQTLTLKEAQFRQANHWKPRPLTSAARLQYAASRMEQGCGASDHVTAVDASYVARQLARRESDGGDRREGRGERGGTAHSTGPSSAHKVSVCLSVRPSFPPSVCLLVNVCEWARVCAYV